MGKKINEARVNALKVAYYYGEMKAMLHMVYRSIDGNLLRGYEKQKLEEAFSFLNSMLYQRENDAYRSYFMWNLAASDEEHEEAKRIAYKRYLHEGMLVMQYLDAELKNPPSYLGITAEEFRADIEEEFNKS